MTNAEKAQAEQQDKNALLDAFKSILSSLGGGQGKNPELASGDSGGTPAGGGVGGGPPVGAGELNGGQSIVGPFQKNFAKCTQEVGLGQCKFDNQGIMGDSAHRARRSCHNAGEAIDVGALTCEGANLIPSSHPRFFEMANCLANNSNDELEVIFHRAQGPNMIQKSDHVGHMHVQLKHCRMIYGQ